jgi:hypothetical protein
VSLGEVLEQDEDADVRAVGLDVLAPALVDGDALVAQDLALEAGLGPVEAADERREADGPVVTGECERAVGEGGVALERQEGVPSVLVRAQLGQPRRQRVERGVTSRRLGAVAAGPQDGEDVRPAHMRLA